MPTSGKDLLKEAMRAGWTFNRQKGSHAIVEKAGHPPAAIPIHGNQDLGKGMEHKLRKQLGLKK